MNVKGKVVPVYLMKSYEGVQV